MDMLGNAARAPYRYATRATDSPFVPRAMIKSAPVIVLIGATSFIYADVHSHSVFWAIALPAIDFPAPVALGLWFALLFYRQGAKQTASPNGGDTGGFGGFEGSGGNDGGG
jgi:uncharacterized membrane protein YgcG